MPSGALHVSGGDAAELRPARCGRSGLPVPVLGGGRVGGMLEMMRRNYDVVGTAATGSVLWVLGAPWPLWLVWSGIIVFLVQDRIRASRLRAH